mgnify:CR=1 FL=1
MNHRPDKAFKLEPLCHELQSELLRVRQIRNFNPEEYLFLKIESIKEYFEEHRLKAAVLGMSGGVDSAVVLGILREFKRKYPNAIKQIYPICLPVNETFAIGHEKSQLRVIEQCRLWDMEYRVINLGAIHTAIRNVFPPTTPWANGQLVSNIRTPMLYHQATISTAAGVPAIVAGTTNRDEGAYLGYVGKVSDGMVDLQLIADLHKSEVYKLADCLGVCQGILEAVPAGEMYDGRVDEEVFGATYDFVELYLNHLCENWCPEGYPAHWSEKACAQYDTLSTNIEALHRYNSHKYLVGSPAVHLNVLPSAVPGGWRE